MNDTVHKQTVLSMLERDIENKYALVKQNALSVTTSLSTSVPLLKVALPSANQWIAGKEKQYLPKVQDMVNLCVESAFADPEVTVEEAYNNCRSMFNQGMDEMIKANSKYSLELVDQVLQILIGTKVSL